MPTSRTRSCSLVHLYILTSKEERKKKRADARVLDDSEHALQLADILKSFPTLCILDQQLGKCSTPLVIYPFQP